MDDLILLLSLGIAGAVGLTAWAFLQKEHTLLRIYGPAACYRWFREWERDKDNQYTERSGDGRPFPLVKRSWVYRAAKGLPMTEGFGTQKDLHTPGTHTIRPAPFGFTAAELPDDAFAVDVGRESRFFRVRFPLNRSGGSFGAFGAHWTRAASDGCGLLNREYAYTDQRGDPRPHEGFLDNTGEGGLAPHHLSVSARNQEYLNKLNARARANGHKYFFRFDKTATSDGKIVDVPLALNIYKIDKDGRAVINPHRHILAGDANSERPRRLVIQIGPSLSGFRTSTGEIDWEWLDYVCGLPDVAGIEVKGQQGAKPNDGGTVKAAKLTDELRALRGFCGDGDYVSPERLPFIRPLGNGVGLEQQVQDLISVILRIQGLANVRRRGLITGYKMTYCGQAFLEELACHLKGGHGPDYLIVDGAEGGTGAADPIMTDHVGVHTYHGIVRTHQVLVEHGVRDRICLVASGRLLDSADVAKILCLGADYCNGIRGYMMSTGCIQSTVCQSGKCPTGITTHDSWRLRGFDPTLKCVRFANYGFAVRAKFMKLARVAGIDYRHGRRFTLSHLDVVTGIGKLTRGDEVYDVKS